MKIDARINFLILVFFFYSCSWKCEHFWSNWSGKRKEIYSHPSTKDQPNKINNCFGPIFLHQMRSNSFHISAITNRRVKLSWCWKKTILTPINDFIWLGIEIKTKLIACSTHVCCFLFSYFFCGFTHSYKYY